MEARMWLCITPEPQGEANQATLVLGPAPSAREEALMNELLLHTFMLTFPFAPCI